MDNPLPNITTFTDDDITEADFKVALGNLLLYLTEAIGVNGENLNMVPASVGSNTKHVYTNANKQIVASTATVGSGTNPVYMANGAITKSGSTVGATNRPVYLKAGVITQCSSTIGGSYVAKDNGSLAVGSYVIANLCTASGTNVNNGATTAGTNLRVNNSSTTTISAGSSAGTKLSGTWRNVSGIQIGGVSNGSYRIGLWQRVS